MAKLAIAPIGNPNPDRPKPKTAASRARRGSLLFIVIALVALAAYAWLGREVPQQSLLIQAVERGDVEDSVTAVGNLQPRDYVDVGAQVSGQLQRIHADIGDVVNEGELLAEIDAKTQAARAEASRAQLEALRAQLAERRAQRELAELQYRRQQKLWAENATSEDAVQVAKATLAVNHAQIDELTAQIKEAKSTLRGDEITLGYTKIYAPMHGVVVSVIAKQGQTLNANQTAPVILRIADLAVMTVWTKVSEADVSRLRLGMNAYFTPLGMPERRWEGKLRQILPTPEVLNNVVLFTALFDVENPHQTLMTQMTAEVFFVVAAAKNVPIVPVAALRQVHGTRATINVVGADDTPVERGIKLGVTNRVYAEVVSGLKPGERIVVGEQRPESDKAAGSAAGKQGMGPRGTPRMSLGGH